jgi:hypothetical protein
MSRSNSAAQQPNDRRANARPDEEFMNVAAARRPRSVPETGAAAHRLFSWSKPQDARRRQGTNQVPVDGGLRIGFPASDRGGTPGALEYLEPDAQPPAGRALAALTSLSLCPTSNRASTSASSSSRMPRRRSMTPRPQSWPRSPAWPPPRNGFRSVAATNANGELARARRLTSLTSPFYHDRRTRGATPAVFVGGLLPVLRPALHGAARRGEPRVARPARHAPCCRVRDRRQPTIPLLPPTTGGCFCGLIPRVRR